MVSDKEFKDIGKWDFVKIIVPHALFKRNYILACLNEEDYSNVKANALKFHKNRVEIKVIFSVNMEGEFSTVFEDPDLKIGIDFEAYSVEHLTIDEYAEIEMWLKSNGYMYNKKTNKLLNCYGINS